MINAITILLGIMGIAMLAIVNFSTTKQNKILLKDLAETRKQTELLKEQLRNTPGARMQDGWTDNEKREYKIVRFATLLDGAGFMRFEGQQEDATLVIYWFLGKEMASSPIAYRMTFSDMSFSIDGGNRWTPIYL